VRIAHALGEGPEGFSVWLSGTSIGGRPGADVEDGGPMTTEDLIRFEVLAPEIPDEVSEILSKELNEMQRVMLDPAGPGGIAPFRFRPEDLVSLFSGSMLYEVCLHYAFAENVSMSPSAPSI
jgi:hypothetical protein